MKKQEIEKYYREQYHEARANAITSGKLDKIRQNTGVYTTQMIAALRDMAKNDVYPDGDFCDDECCVWFMFHAQA